MRSFLRVMLFTLAGPYVGLLAMGVLIGSYTLATTGSTRDFVLGPELLSPGILIVAYSVGGIPALLSGIAAIFVGRWLSGWRYWLTMALVGGAISLAGALVLVSGGPEMVGVREQAPLLVLVTLAGAVAALACAALFDGLARLVRR
jgi:hypothetical protein